MNTLGRFSFIFIFLGFISCEWSATPDYNWSHYLGDSMKMQYSKAQQVNKSNVSQLEIIWTFSSNNADPKNRSQIQCNPLIIDGKLYGTSAKLQLFSLDARTGENLWTFDPFEGNFEDYGMGVNRGLAWHQDEHSARLFFTAGDQLYAINPENGTPIESFGIKGSVDLHKGLGEEAKSLFINSNTPGIVYKDLLIQGSRVSESIGAAPGHIRAFDVYNGDIKWIFHTIPKPGEFGYETWPKDAHARSGGANVWAGFAIDEERGIVYCPTGSASYDFYGGDREGDNLFANCIIALDATTGKHIWHFQTIHHDLWDKDLPVAPNLVTITKDGRRIDALVQATKNGFFYVLDRVSGEPLFPIDEIDVNQSELDGEYSSKTQPWPNGYPPFSRQSITENDLADRNEEAAKFARHIFETTFHENLYEPPSQEGTIIFPGFDGGGEWGGAAYNPVTSDLIINSNELPWRVIMDKVVPVAKGEGRYKSFCQSCHGEKFQGSELFGNVPSLINLKSKKTISEVSEIVRFGKGVMPGISWMPEEDIVAIYDYISGDEDPDNKIKDDSWPYPYRMRNYEKLYAPDGYPMIKPPWGQLTSINLNSAQINWQVPLGSYEQLMDIGMKNTGTENYGGPVLTASGLIFIAATSDEKIRAFDAENGEILWEHTLPAAGYATPSIYTIDKRQYITIACGGGKLNTKSGDEYVTFALPSKIK